MIPPRAQWFQDRAEMTRLDGLLAGGGTVVVESAQPAPAGGVLAGMGGVGKTQLAAAHARSAWSKGDLDVLVWVTASSRSAVVAGYAQAAAELLAADANDAERSAREFLAWLEPKPDEQRCRWLVVLDDVTDPVNMTGLWPPTSLSGFTLATTRRKDAALTGDGWRLITVGLFTHDQALAYLTRALAVHDLAEPEQQLAALADELGHLPLALSQAAAYLIDTGIGCSAYRNLLADRTRTLADAAPDALPDDQHHTVAAAWSLSIDRADTLRPPGLARPLLQLAALLNAGGIPKTVLASPPVLAHLTQAAGSDVTPEDVHLALSALRRLSLIELSSDAAHQEVRVHQLIQRAVRDILTPAERQHRARSVADALLTSWPDPERDTALAAALRANTTALFSTTHDGLLQPDVHAVLFRAGGSLGDSGQVTAACDYFTRLHDHVREHLGADHPDTLATRNNQAFWRAEAGDPAGAAAALDALLQDRLRVLGPDHRETLTTRNNLAGWRGQAGDPTGAAKAYDELLQDQLRVLGPNHPDTLTTRHNLALWRRQAGDPTGAATAHAELLQDQLRVLGPNHPNTLTTRHNFAACRGQAGDLVGAATAYAELLQDQLRVLGPDHPDTLNTRLELASWRGQAGDEVGAAKAYDELLQDQLRVLGPDHPNTLTTRHNLALSRGEAGDPVGAAKAYDELLRDKLGVLGPDHPSTLNTRSNLAGWRGRAGDPTGAAKAYDELLQDQLRVLGPNHPDTLTTRHNLAFWRSEAGEIVGVATAWVQLLRDCLRVLGPDHPDTLNTRSNLAGWRGRIGDPAGAAKAYDELLRDELRVLGPNHPDTLTTRHNLAFWLGRSEAG
ncbi:tetratricopeptide repeat protein [Streptomyces sp. NPDC094154]|uniref:tetratricopeptide repeat protein n=1 Tax=Streptomyces sp. NPDC094154 TaxID=3366059 RepID=UPI0037F3B82B